MSLTLVDARRPVVLGILGAFARAGYTAAEGRRFANKVRLTEHGCWLWTGSTNSKGYGCVGLRSEAWLAHRLAYTVFFGPIPEGHDIDHAECGVIACLNPAGLEAVLPAENRARQAHWYWRNIARGPRRPEHRYDLSRYLAQLGHEALPGTEALAA